MSLFQISSFVLNLEIGWHLARASAREVSASTCVAFLFCIQNNVQIGKVEGGLSLIESKAKNNKRDKIEKRGNEN